MVTVKPVDVATASLHWHSEIGFQPHSGTSGALLVLSPAALIARFGTRQILVHSSVAHTLPECADC